MQPTTPDFPGSHLNNEQRVAVIRNFNIQEGLPRPEEPDKALYNGALFEAQLLRYDTFLLPQYKGFFTHPLSNYPQNKQYEILTWYSATLARINLPQSFFIGDPGHSPGVLTVTIHTHEINSLGYWTFVQRTVHLHAPEPIVSINIIGQSTVLAAPDPDHSLECPEGIYFTIRANLRGPN